MPDAHHRIAVRSETAYIEEQSSPETNQFVFAYTITIENTGTLPAKLMTRHWIITDANGKVQEVRGDGVVGEQPHLKPGQGFRYSSGAVLETPLRPSLGHPRRRGGPRHPASQRRSRRFDARTRGSPSGT